LSRREKKGEKGKWGPTGVIMVGGKINVGDF